MAWQYRPVIPYTWEASARKSAVQGLLPRLQRGFNLGKATSWNRRRSSGCGPRRGARVWRRPGAAGPRRCEDAAAAGLPGAPCGEAGVPAPRAGRPWARTPAEVPLGPLPALRGGRSWDDHREEEEKPADTGQVPNTERSKTPKYLRAYEPVGQFHQAAREGSVDTVRRLLRSGIVSVNDTDRRNRTALHYACAYGHREVVHLLLTYQRTVNMFDKEHGTPLIKASQREFPSCVDTLLGHGADPNKADMYGNTAFHYAVLNDDLELAGLLLAYEANIEAKTKDGFTPYLLALQENKDLIAEFLKDMGTDVHAEGLLNRKHHKIHHRKMCKHTARRPEAARSTSPSFSRRATNRRAPYAPETKKKETRKTMNLMPSKT
uniref:ankyrin repeat domain-containing protein 7-like n=1 Tax=Jaculus jaculus TaxID=51337 RepID=UPI001E1B5F7E|nr:ankyrin repeat domain-containing protein 7-like [Jaculus jaculus]